MEYSDKEGSLVITDSTTSGELIPALPLEKRPKMALCVMEAPGKRMTNKIDRGSPAKSLINDSQSMTSAKAYSDRSSASQEILIEAQIKVNRLLQRQAEKEALANSHAANIAIAELELLKGRSAKSTGSDNASTRSRSVRGKAISPIVPAPPSPLTSQTGLRDFRDDLSLLLEQDEYATGLDISLKRNTLSAEALQRHETLTKFQDDHGGIIHAETTERLHRFEAETQAMKAKMYAAECEHTAAQQAIRIASAAKLELIREQEAAREAAAKERSILEQSVNVERLVAQEAIRKAAEQQHNLEIWKQVEMAQAKALAEQLALQKQENWLSEKHASTAVIREINEARQSVTDREESLLSRESAIRSEAMTKATNEARIDAARLAEEAINRANFHTTSEARRFLDSEMQLQRKHFLDESNILAEQKELMRIAAEEASLAARRAKLEELQVQSEARAHLQAFRDASKHNESAMFMRLQQVENEKEQTRLEMLRFAKAAEMQNVRNERLKSEMAQMQSRDTPLVQTPRSSVFSEVERVSGKFITATGTRTKTVPAAGGTASAGSSSYRPPSGGGGKPPYRVDPANDYGFFIPPGGGDDPQVMTTRAETKTLVEIENPRRTRKKRILATVATQTTQGVTSEA